MAPDDTQAGDVMSIPPDMAHLIRDRGIPLFKQVLTDRLQKGDGNFPNSWIREDKPPPVPFLREVIAEMTVEEDPPARKWVWCAPVPVALLVRWPYLPPEMNARKKDRALAAAVWAIDKIKLKALDALYRLSEGPRDYIEQVLTMYDQRNDGDENERSTDRSTGGVLPTGG